MDFWAISSDLVGGCSRMFHDTTHPLRSSSVCGQQLYPGRCAGRRNEPWRRKITTSRPCRAARCARPGPGPAACHRIDVFIGGARAPCLHYLVAFNQYGTDLLSPRPPGNVPCRSTTLQTLVTKATRTESWKRREGCANVDAPTIRRSQNSPLERFDILTTV